MGKYSLGIAKIELNSNLNKKDFYLNTTKATSIENDIEKQLEIIETSMLNIANILNRAVNCGVVKGKRAEVFKSWGKKAKSQSNNTLKLMEKLNNKYYSDVKEYPLKVLNSRIEELERKIANMSK